MPWSSDVACFFAGVFLANAVPHLVHGLSGDRFPSPFAHPPGRGLSSPTVNVVWGVGNLALGVVLCRVGSLALGNRPALIACLAGVLGIGLYMSVQFARKDPR